MPLDIWTLQIAETLPFDSGTRKMRTALLSQELARRGHRVLWWTSAFNHAKKDWLAQDGESRDLMPGVKLRFLKGCGYTRNVSPKRFIDHRMVARKFAEAAAQLHPPDVIVASMPTYDLSYQAYLLAKKHNIPFILDVRDKWPDTFTQHLPAPLRLAADLMLSGDRKMLREQCRGADSVVSMMNGLLGWAQKLGGRPESPADRVFLLGETRPPEEDTPNILDIPYGKFVVAFIGTFGTHSSPEVLLKAAKRLQYRDDILFVLAGDGNFFGEIKRRAKDLPNLRLPGWLNRAQMYALLSRSHAGVVSGTAKAEAFPNKAFVYLSMGLPLLSDSDGELRAFMEQERTGLHYPLNDEAALADRILKLKENAALRAEMSANARRIFLDRMDAEKIYAAYADHVEKVAARRGGKLK
ncbi:MAG: glycosyltransferase family 4 protein [Elusimicrobia bacterium]|nr:glycosyltransferase family 4 protein [Elusimicrobiota bacterium]